MSSESQKPTLSPSEAFKTAESRIEQARGTLDLAHLGLTELPDSLGGAKYCRNLDIRDNRLTVLPDWLGDRELAQWPWLLYLNISDNRLTVLPDWLGDREWLQALCLGGNQLQALPDSLGKLRSLSYLDLTGNQLKELPQSLGDLCALGWLDLSDNQLQALPESLGKLGELEILDLSGNQLQALPDSLGDLRSLKYLDLSGNQLQALPESLGRLAQLKTLKLGDNQLKAVPNSLGNLRQMQEMSLDGNPLTYPAPAVVEQGTKAVLKFLRTQQKTERSAKDAEAGRGSSLRSVASSWMKLLGLLLAVIIVLLAVVIVAGLICGGPKGLKDLGFSIGAIALVPAILGGLSLTFYAVEKPLRRWLRQTPYDFVAELITVAAALNRAGEMSTPYDLVAELIYVRSRRKRWVLRTLAVAVAALGVWVLWRSSLRLFLLGTFVIVVACAIAYATTRKSD